MTRPFPPRKVILRLRMKAFFTSPPQFFCHFASSLLFYPFFYLTWFILPCYMSFCPPRIKVESHRNKIIVTTRNPKDVAVSLYHHHIFLSEMYNYSGDFQDWIPLFLEGKRKKVRSRPRQIL